MTSYTFSNAGVTGQIVDAQMFGGMMIAHHDDITEAGTFTGAIEDLNIGNVRWGGGTDIEEQWDLATPNAWAAGDRVAFDDFMAWAHQEGKSVALTVPVSGVFVGAPDGSGAPRALDPQKLQDIEAFLMDVLSESNSSYADAVIDSIEIGNEYFVHGITSEEYGIVLDAILGIIEDVQQTLGDDYAAEDPKILAQLGSPFSIEFQEGGSEENFDGTFVERVDLSNKLVTDQISAENADLIDGVVDHYFYRGDGATDPLFEDSSGERQYIDRKLKYWQNQAENEETYKDLELHVTAWNTQAASEGDLGLVAVSTMLEQFQTMVEMGADAAHVWAVQNNTSNDLYGAEDKPGSGVTFNGAAFEWMSESLVGAEIVDSNIEGGPVEVNAYLNEDEYVFFISSRSTSTQDIEIDFSGLVGGFMSATGEIIGVGADADGQHFISGQGFVATETYNEHDASVAFESISASDMSGGVVDISLDAFEVAKVVFRMPEGLNEVGTNGANTWKGGNTGDHYQGLGGHDRIKGFGGDDHLEGNAGNDKLWGGAGNDALYGGAGSDGLRGEGGADRLFGGDGRDFLYGMAGDDVLDGGSGNDKLLGGAGRDVMTGGAGADTFVFSDYVHATKGDHTLQWEYNERITDFDIDEDVLHFAVAGVDDVSDLTIFYKSSEGSLVVQANGPGGVGGSIILEGLDQSDRWSLVNEGEFIFDLV